MVQMFVLALSVHVSAGPVQAYSGLPAILKSKIILNFWESKHREYERRKERPPRKKRG